MNDSLMQARMELGSQRYAAPAIVNIILPGVGQMMKGQVGSGLLILVVVLGGYALFALALPAILAFIVHVWVIVSAYRKVPSREVYAAAKRFESLQVDDAVDFVPPPERPREIFDLDAPSVYVPKKPEPSPAPGQSASSQAPLKAPVRGWGLAGWVVNKKRGY